MLANVHRYGKAKDSGVSINPVPDTYNPVPDLYQSKARHPLLLSCTLIESFSVCERVGWPEMAIIKVFSDQWIPSHFGHFVLGSHARQEQIPGLVVRFLIRSGERRFGFGCAFGSLKATCSERLFAFGSAYKRNLKEKVM
jgi:hypothetical protein